MDNKKYISITSIPSFSTISLRDARKAFLAYKEKKIIISGVYDDMEWRLCDERATYTVSFSIDQDNYYRNYAFLGIPMEKIIDYMKAYVLCVLEELVMVSIQSIVREIRYVLNGTVESITEGGEHGDYYFMNRVSEFFSLIPYGDSVDTNCLDRFQDQIDIVEEDIESRGSGSQRTLASFDSYLKFNDIMTSFWKEATDEQKLFFFPVYLWWNLSAIIPMRPVEFVLTPRDCITEYNGEYFIKIRKTRLKGRKGNITHKVDSDYRTVTYSLRKDLAEEVLWYIEETQKYRNNDLYTLFIADTHYSKWGHCTPYTSRYFTYCNLSTCLRYFYSQVIEDIYGYRVIQDRVSSYLRDDEINYLHLGDTRHLSIISMLSQGATPLVAMMLAGHKDINITAHYASNIGQYIECRTYRQYKALLNGKENYIPSVHRPFPSLGKFVSVGKDGRCYSEHFASGSIEDCKNVAGPNGEIGYCLNCDFYYSECTGRKNTKERYIEKIQKECQMLSDVVNRVRLQKGEPEEILQTILNLRSAEYSYEEYLKGTMKEADYAQKKTD